MTTAQKNQSIPIGPLGPWLPNRAEIITITPHQAITIIENYNTNNRAIVRTTVNRIRECLIAGEWRVNGETIIFSSSGTLMDGQNRLTACVESAVPLKTWVVFGEDKEVFRTIDRGKSRDLSDDLSICGEVNCKALAAAIRLIYEYSSGVRGQNILSSNHPSQTLHEFLNENPGIRESVTICGSNPIRLLPIPMRTIVFSHYLFGLKSSKARDEFFEKLASGAGMEIGDPILALRQKLFQDRIQNPKSLKGNVGTATFLVLHQLIRSWNAWRRGQRLTKIQVSQTEENGRRVLSQLPNIE